MILITISTRPDYIKLNSLIEYWNKIGFSEFKIFLTYQHEELCNELRKKFGDKILNLDLNYQKLNNRLDEINFNVLLQFNKLDELSIKIDYMILYGDTSSTLAVAMACYHRNIKIIFIESGLRSYSTEPFPEEFNRRATSLIADIHLCPTEENYKNLIQEKIGGNKYITGNLILDSLKGIEAGSPTDEILVTLHRRENIDKIEEWFTVLEKLANVYPRYTFVLPLHKNPAIFKYKDMFKKVRCVEPLDHKELIDILKNCKYIISDSGGICEEGSYFGKPIFLCRRKTERPEANDFYISCPTPEQLYSKFIIYDQKHWNDTTNLPYKCPFGDGNSAYRITEILLSEGIFNEQE